MEQKSVKLLLAITKSNWGGAQRYVYDIATHFNTDKDFSVSVLAGGSGDLISKLHDNNIRTIPLETLGRDIGIIKDTKSFLKLFQIILTEKPDILHLNSSKIGLLGGIVGRLCGVKKIIFTAHAWPFNETRPKYQRRIFKVFGMVTVFLSHRTIAVSQNVITSLGAPKWLFKKMTCVYTGIDSPNLYEEGLFFKNLSLEKTPGTHIVSIGELHTSKGLDRALIALAKCKHIPWTYHIIGTGEKKAYLETLVSQFGLNDRVMFHGFIENASLYLNSFDLFLFPSRTEALGYVAIEALFSKLPVIASNAGGIPEVLFDDPYTKLIDCNNEKALKEALFSALQKPIIVDEKKRPGRMKFLPRFMFTATRKIYLG
jgi:glycosyltransferase involved in cell wall biosynthesis